MAGERKKFRFLARLVQNGTMDAGYVVFPYDIRKEFGKGRVRVDATFDGITYQGSIVNMGVKDAEGNVCYIIGVLKSIRQQIGKQFGDEVEVTVSIKN
ncbi:MAG: DUF1905 domain-containing protein [Bacteroidales bacterium]|nr:DUF1905 domain-containing protein [Bacteroidales bacterium]